MSFSYQGDNDLQRGTFVASGGGESMQITPGFRMFPGLELRSREAIALVLVRYPGQAVA